MKLHYLFLLSIMVIISSCSHNKGSAGYYKLGKPYKIADKTYTPKENPDYDETGMASWYGTDFHRKETANGGTFDRNAITAAHKTLPLPSMVRVTNLANNKTLIVMVNDRGPFSKDRIIDLSERAADILGFKDKGIAKVRVQFLPGQTKRLLADLPNSKNKAANNSIMGNVIPKFFNTSADYVESGNAGAAPETKSHKAKQARKELIEAKNNAQTQEYSDTTPTDNDSDSSAQLNEKDTPALKPEEKAEEISKDAHFIQAGMYSVMANAKRVEKNLAQLGTTNITPVKVNGKLLYKVTIGPILDKKVAELTLKKAIILGHPDAMIIKESGKS